VARQPRAMNRPLLAQIVLAVTCCLATGPAGAGRDQSKASTWPQIRRGLWQIHSTRSQPSGKTQHWAGSVRSCADPTELFRPYWGFDLLEEAGCRHQVTQLSATEFKVVSECTVRRAKRSIAEALIKVPSDDVFEITVELTEGKRKYHGTEVGRWAEACDPTSLDGGGP
jgi:hypothetical protein